MAGHTETTSTSRMRQSKPRIISNVFGDCYLPEVAHRMQRLPHLPVEVPSSQVVVCKSGAGGLLVKKGSRLGTLRLDPIQGRRKKGTGDDQTYHEWCMTHPGTRQALEVPHQKEWKLAAPMHGSERQGLQSYRTTDDGTDLIRATLIWKWYHASL